jgi:rhomboid family protein
MRTTTSQASLGPEFTPRAIRILVLVTCITSILCSIFDLILVNILSTKALSTFLALTWWGISHFFLWQPVTYLFTYGAGSGIDVYWLLGLAMYMYILWVMGSNIVERVGEKSFLRLYFTSGILSGIGAVLFVPVLHQSMVFAGPAPAILAVLVAWTMLNSTSTLLLFFILPIQAKWLTAIVLGAIFLINLSALAFVPLIFYMLGPIISYVYCVTAWNLVSPFPVTHSFDRRLMRFGQQIYDLIPLRGQPQGKIFDINTGKAVDKDDRFMDAMLDKISKHGKESLSWWERRKMEKISKNRNRPKY